MTTTEILVVKGNRIRASWLECYPICLSGMQMKLGAREMSVTGVVRHVRGDDPTNPKAVRLYVDAESGNYEGHTVECVKCGHDHVEVDLKHVKELF